MKTKVFFFMLTLLVAAGSVSAQDTIVSKFLKSNYLFPSDQWLDTNSEVGYVTWIGGPSFSNVYKRCLADTNDSICGIAMGLHFLITSRDIVDTTLALSKEDLGVFKKAGSAMRQIGDTLLLDMADTPSYYFKLDLQRPHNYEMPVISVYEMYYDNPLAIPNTFYLGTTLNTSRTPAGGFIGENFETTPLQLFEFTTVGKPTYSEHLYYETINDHSLEFVEKPMILFWFPILCTEDTSQIENGDTVSVTLADLTGQRIVLFPNPATNTVRVESGERNIEGIEVVDMLGRVVLRKQLPAPQSSLILDLTPLPTATYILRIHTPEGITIKRLVVQ